MTRKPILFAVRAFEIARQTIDDYYLEKQEQDEVAEQI
jgi:hypothetical protein